MTKWMKRGRYVSPKKFSRKAYERKNRTKLNAKRRLRYYLKHKEQMDLSIQKKIDMRKLKRKLYNRIYNRAYQQRPTIKFKHNKYLLLRRQKSPSFRLSTNLRNRIHLALRGKLKSASTIALLGCSISYFKQYIETQFQPGMSWANYGKWHIDHINPCASFDLTKPEEQQKCFNYTNLRPLWAIDNWTRPKTSI